MNKALFFCVVAALGVPAVACNKSAAPTVTSEQAGASADAFVEQHDGGSIAWTVTGDGKAHAVVLGPDGKPVAAKITGALQWNGRAIPMKQDDKTGALDGEGPTLEADITQIGYVINDGTHTFQGTLHVPRGGTKELAESARATAKLTPGKVGPHGGKVELVGNDRVEVVANPNGGEVRAYVLDADYKVVPIGNRRITVGVVADKPEVVVLTPGPHAEYATGRLVTVVDPVKVTVAVSVGAETHVALVGHAPEAVVVVGAAAPRCAIFVKGSFWIGPGVVVVGRDDDDDDDEHHHGHHHHTNVHIKEGKHGHVHVNVH